MNKKSNFAGNDRHQSQNKLAIKVKLLTHIIRNVKAESGFRIVGSRVIHNIIRILCHYFTAIFTSIPDLLSVRVYGKDSIHEFLSLTLAHLVLNSEPIDVTMDK